MLDTLKRILKTYQDMITSKKFQAALLSAVAWGLGKLGFELDVEILLPLVGGLWVYIIGQGMADWGKSAALPPAE